MPYERGCFILGITTSSILSGLLIGVSASTIPALLAAPANSDSALLAQWSHLYERGARTAPPLSLLAATLHFINAYNLYHRDVPSRSYKFIAAGVSLLGIIPWTIAAIMPTNKKLFARAEGRKDGEESVRELVERWGTLNWVRAGLALSATLLAFEAL